MMRSIILALAAVATIAGSSTFSFPAQARGMGGFGHGGFAHSGGFAHPGGFGQPLGYRNGFAFRHRFHGRGFAFVGPYAYGDPCLQRIWTAWGWRWVNVCY
jgi:hypothetical protein